VSVTAVAAIAAAVEEQAAGTAAAMSVRKGLPVDRTDVKALQKALVRDGARLE
jgi:hypothetical protein